MHTLPAAARVTRQSQLKSRERKRKVVKREETDQGIKREEGEK